MGKSRTCMRTTGERRRQIAEFEQPVNHDGSTRMRDVRDTQWLWRNHDSTTISFFMDLQLLLAPSGPSFLWFSWGFPNSGTSKHFQGLYRPCLKAAELALTKDIVHQDSAANYQLPIYLPRPTAGTSYRLLCAVRKHHNYAICHSFFFLAAKTTITGSGAS